MAGIGLDLGHAGQKRHARMGANGCGQRGLDQGGGQAAVIGLQLDQVARKVEPGLDLGAVGQATFVFALPVALCLDAEAAQIQPLKQRRQVLRQRRACGQKGGHRGGQGEGFHRHSCDPLR